MLEDKTVLTSAEVDQKLPSLTGWKRHESTLSKDFVFSNFREITSFLNHLVKTITEQNHHPDFSLHTGTKTVSVSVTTHSKKAITESDILFVSTLNQWPSHS